MFTGIIQAVGKVVSVGSNAAGRRIAIDLMNIADRPGLGASVAVNGICLSVVKLDGPVASFDVVPETVARSNIGRLTRQAKVNLELPLRASDRVDGHFVLGHIDTTCSLVDVRDDAPGKRIRFEPIDRTCLRFIVPKGFVALDGISLTVAEICDDGTFEVAIIPDTLKRTTMGHRRTGDLINLETDILVKSVVRQQDFSDRDNDRRLTTALRASGFPVDER